MDNHIIFTTLLKTCGLHHTATLPRPIPGIHINMLAPQTFWAVVCIAVAYYFCSAFLTGEILNCAGETFHFFVSFGAPRIGLGPHPFGPRMCNTHPVIYSVGAPRFARDFFLAVARKSLGTSSPIFSAEKIWLRCSNLGCEQSSLLARPDNTRFARLSGRRDLNSDCLIPNQVCYRYTTPRF